MGVMNIDDLKKDMVLSDDVTDITGRLLLQKGQKLRPKQVNIMKKWGVSEVNVVDDANDEQRSQSHKNQKETEQIEQEIMPIFKYVDLDHPAIKELFRLSVQFRKDQDVPEEKPKSLPSESSDTHEVHPTEDVREKISQKELKLPEIPDIVFELNDILSDPMSTADNLAQVVAKSPSLTAVLLKIVNSSFYGFSSRIDTISRAVTIIGTREISSLALVICTITVFKNIPREILSMRSFLKHGFACGLLSRMLAANRNIQQTEQLFVAGLLHDIGRVIIYKYFPEQAKALLTRCMASELVLHQEEPNFLGCNHTDISRYVLQEWKFPSTLEDNIFYHHNPMAANEPVQATVVHLADIIVNGLGIGSSGEKFVPPLNTEAWELLGLPPSSFEVVIKQASHQLAALDLFLQE